MLYPWDTGYEGNGTYCVNIDECANATLNNCHDTWATCVDFKGGYNCSCNPGYEGSSTMNAPTTCTDYDACSDATVDCGSGARCASALAIS